ncbi:hypothetical protein [Aquirufa sp.]|jgi:hypothetical protein|uniref:hypothetical protein n=1 Tax=Aquirufa sp. TaxID=2676249 RepID=UPI0037848F54
MISSYQSAIKQLNTLNLYMSSNVTMLLLNIDLYDTLMSIRDRLQKEVASYEKRKLQMNSKYAAKIHSTALKRNSIFNENSEADNCKLLDIEIEDYNL